MNKQQLRELANQPFEPGHPAYVQNAGPLGPIINGITRLELWRQRPHDTTAHEERMAELATRQEAVQRNGKEERAIGMLQIAALEKPELLPEVWAAQNMYHGRRAAELDLTVATIKEEKPVLHRLRAWITEKRAFVHQNKARKAAGNLIRIMQ